MCKTRKRRYATEAEAKIILVGMRARRAFGNQRRREVRVYWCPSCWGWHLTSRENVT